MTTDKAAAILNQAKETGWFPDPLPEAPGDLVNEAKLLVMEARDAFDRGAKGDAVKSILALAEYGEEECMQTTPPSSLSVQPTTVRQETVQPTTSSPESVSTSQSSQSSGAVGNFINYISKENLPIPSDVSDPPELPRDISLIDDASLRSLHARFNSVLARANWLLSVEEADELCAKQIADVQEAQAIRRAGERVDPVTGKPKTVAVLAAEAASEPEVREWRYKQSQHHIKSKLLRALRDTYASNCERCSRDWSMRTDEYKKTHH